MHKRRKKPFNNTVKAYYKCKEKKCRARAQHQFRNRKLNTQIKISVEYLSIELKSVCEREIELHKHRHHLTIFSSANQNSSNKYEKSYETSITRIAENQSSQSRMNSRRKNISHHHRYFNYAQRFMTKLSFVRVRDSIVISLISKHFIRLIGIISWCILFEITRTH